MKYEIRLFKDDNLMDKLGCLDYNRDGNILIMNHDNGVSFLNMNRYSMIDIIKVDRND